MRIIIRVVGVAAALAVIGLGVGWLAAGLTREAAGLALGVVVGVVATLPVMLVAIAGRRQEHIVYQDRIVYRVAEPVDDAPAATTSTALTAYTPGQVEVRP